MRRMTAGIRRLWAYYTSHIWCFLITLIFVILTALILITNGYLRSRYVDSLREVVLQNETTILELANANTQALLGAFIQTGCGAAVDTELYKDVDSLLHGADSQGMYLRNIQRKLLEYSYTSNWIVGISIATEEEILCQYSRTQSVGYWRGNERHAAAAFRAVRELLDEGSTPSYRFLSEPLLFQPGGDQRVFHIAFPLKGNAPGDAVESIVLFSFNAAIFQENMDHSISGGQDAIAHMYISDSKGMIVYHSDHSRIGEAQDAYLRQNQLNLLSESLGACGWRINIAIDESVMTDTVNSFYQRGLLLYWVSMCGVLILLFFILTWILRPLKKLSQSIENVKKGDYALDIGIEGRNEIWQVAGQFNEMIRAILEARRQVEWEHTSTLAALERQREAETQALESQINAHFICNTLGVISYEAIETGNHRISVMLKRLSNILRYAFDQRHQKVFLRQEFAWLEQYLYLQKLRFEEKFDYTVELPVEFEDWPCCKLMLQPFVENAIIHGFQNMQTGGWIHIRCERLPDGWACIRIEDNGAGMPPHRLDQVRRALVDKEGPPGTGIGIANVAARIRLYYGDGSRVEISSRPGAGTAVRIIVPGRYREPAARI